MITGFRTAQLRVATLKDRFTARRCELGNQTHCNKGLIQGDSRLNVINLGAYCLSHSQSEILHEHRSILNGYGATDI
jgi:hypothetical protein